MKAEKIWFYGINLSCTYSTWPTLWVHHDWAARCSQTAWFSAGCSGPIVAPSGGAGTSFHCWIHWAEPDTPEKKSLINNNLAFETDQMLKNVKKKSPYPTLLNIVYYSYCQLEFECMLTCRVRTTTVYQSRLWLSMPLFSAARQCLTASSSRPSWQKSWTSFTFTCASPGRAASSAWRRSNNRFQPCWPWRLNKRSCRKQHIAGKVLFKFKSRDAGAFFNTINAVHPPEKSSELTPIISSIDFRLHKYVTWVLHTFHRCRERQDYITWQTVLLSAADTGVLATGNWV